MHSSPGIRPCPMKVLVWFFEKLLNSQKNIPCLHHDRHCLICLSIQTKITIIILSFWFRQSGPFWECSGTKHLQWQRGWIWKRKIVQTSAHNRIQWWTSGKNTLNYDIVLFNNKTVIFAIRKLQTIINIHSYTCSLYIFAMEWNWKYNVMSWTASGAKSPKKDSICLVVKVLAQSRVELCFLFTIVKLHIFSSR